jgi:hypothetical protein
VSPSGRRDSNGQVKQGAKRDAGELDVRFVVVPLTDDPGGVRRARQLAAIVRLLRRAAERTEARRQAQTGP